MGEYKMSKPIANGFRKAALSSSIAAALSLGGVQQAQADIYEFEFENSGCFVSGTTDTCGGAGDGLFTMLTSAGAVLQNTSYPYYGDSTWGYGLRTQMGARTAGDGRGYISIDATNEVGSMAIGEFDFYNGGAAVASNINMKNAGNGDDLWLANMGFAWNGSDIVTQVVLDMAGLMAELPATGPIATGTVYDATSCGVSGACATPASDVAKLVTDIGVAPIATSAYNVNGATGTTTILSQLSLGTIDTDGPGGSAVGGTPMDNGPFGGFNANFDFQKLTVSGYNDETPPVLTLSGSSVVVALGGSFDPSSPGVTVSCADAADGNEDLTDSNTEVDIVIGGDTVDVNAEAIYSVTYTCTDSAEERAAILDPTDSASDTVPDNNSVVKTLTVTVSDVDRPVISATTPTTHEACTAYTDAIDDTGLAISDLQDSPTVADIVKSGFTFGTSPNESVLSIDYDFTDSGTGNPGAAPLAAQTQTRVVNVIDTQAPTITVVSDPTMESTACLAYSASLPTATVEDANGDCNLLASVITTPNTVTCTVPDGDDSVVSLLTYNTTDNADTPNAATTKTVTVTVERAEPVITLNGTASIVLDVDATYTELGMDIHDVQDTPDINDVTVSGSASGINYTISSNVDTSVAGTYTVTYTATDTDANTATVERTVQVGAYASGSNFTMLNPAGTTFGGTNDVVFDWDESENTDVASTNFNMTIVSALPQPFFGNVWTAHHVRVFGPGSYSFDTTCTVAQLEAGISACNNPLVGTQVERFITMTVPTGQVGVHILFDWNATENIDVVNVWDRDAVWIDPDGSTTTKNNLFDGVSGAAPDVTATWKLVSTDFDADGINGSPMVDGPFIGFFANFNVGPSGTAVRLPYTEEVDVDVDFSAKPSAGSMTWLAIVLSPIALLVAMRRKLN